MITIIPAIDIIEGKCVRLSQGNYHQKKIYATDPLEVAKAFEGAGLTHLHLVDLDGAKAQHSVNWKVLETIANHTSLKIDFGGGIKTDRDIATAFNTGAKQITCGSIAVKNPAVLLGWITKYGNDSIILGADVCHKKIAVQGWTENTDIELEAFVKGYIAKGIKYVTCTDIATDGMLSGPNLPLYQELIRSIEGVQLIASGGVSSIDDIKQLNRIGAYGVIIGKAIYEEKITLKQLEAFNAC